MIMKPTILLICDDIRGHTGIGNIGKEIIYNTISDFNFINLAVGKNHPEQGTKINFDETISRETKIPDAQLTLIPYSNYGDPEIIEHLLRFENIDAIFCIADPRYLTGVFLIEDRIRSKVPLIWLNIWDNYPVPYFNAPYYMSCDLLLSISKLTKEINIKVLEEYGANVHDNDRMGEFKGGTMISYVPHGLNENKFYKIRSKNIELKKFKKEIFKGDIPEFSLLFNSRNMKRKNILDTLISWKQFLNKYQPKNSKLILHTEKITEIGTNLKEVIDVLDLNSSVILNTEHYSRDVMNLLYNCVDGVIQLSYNEGWGLSLTESLLTETPFIASCTGGMVDQMGFDEDIRFNDVTKRKGEFLNHGEWAFPVMISNRSLTGSPPTPYIYEDRINTLEVAKNINDLYRIPNQERNRIGALGREWALNRLTSKIMGENIIKQINNLFKYWKPRSKFIFNNSNDIVNPKIDI